MMCWDLVRAPTQLICVFSVQVDPLSETNRNKIG